VTRPCHIQIAALLVGLLFLSFANPGGGAAAATDEESVALPAIKPGYDVPEGARDPFFLPRTEPDEPETAGQEPEEKPLAQAPVTIDGLVGQLRLNGLVADSKSGNAIINGRLYYQGDNIALTERGEAYTLTVVRFTRDPASIVLSFAGQERSLTVAEKTDGGTE